MHSIDHRTGAQLVSSEKGSLVVDREREVSAFRLVFQRNDRRPGKEDQNARVQPADDGYEQRASSRAAAPASAGRTMSAAISVSATSVHRLSERFMRMPTNR